MMIRQTLITACLASVAAAQSTAPDFRLLGTLPPPFNFLTVATAVSGDGAVVVGTSNMSVSSVSTAFRWTLVDGITDIGPLVNANDEPKLNATAINGDGSVVVGSSDGGNNRTAWRWTLSTSMARLSLLPTTYQSYAYGISRNGRSIVGGCATDSPPTGAYIYDTTTGATTALALVGTGPVSNGARTVSNDGTRVVGGSTLWNLSTSTRSTVAAPAGATGFSVNAASDDSTVWVGQSTLNNVQRAVRSVNNTPTVLPLPPTGISSIAICTDALGTIAGGSYTRPVPAFFNDPPTEQRAMIWRADLTSVDLTNYATGTLSLNLGGTILRSCNGISADGRVLVGDGRSATGASVSWMLRLPGAVTLCAADLGQQGGFAGPDGVLDNNDFITFIAAFFTANARADVGRAGGLRGGDRLLDNNDFISFINLFFEGCD